MFYFLSEQFKSDDCFIFQKFNTSVDQRVVNDFCDKLTRNLEAGSTSVKDAEEQMRKVSGLVFLDWERIKREGGSSSEECSISACRRTIATLKSHLKNNEQARNFLAVNLSLATVIYIHMDPAKGTSSPNQMQLVRRYFEELLVPSKEVDWRLMGFEVSPEDPDDPLPPRCEQCSKHVLDINALDENFRTKITDLHHEEGVADVQNKRMRK